MIKTQCRLVCRVVCVVAGQHAVVAEWLRRLTRNQFRSAGVGSNPTDRESFFSIATKLGYDLGEYASIRKRASLVQW